MSNSTGQKRKYVLFKKDGEQTGPKVCAFFSSEVKTIKAATHC